jgi:hypothetical protein
MVTGTSVTGWFDRLEELACFDALVAADRTRGPSDLDE